MRETLLIVFRNDLDQQPDAVFAIRALQRDQDSWRLFGVDVHRGLRGLGRTQGLGCHPGPAWPEPGRHFWTAPAGRGCSESVPQRGFHSRPCAEDLFLACAGYRHDPAAADRGHHSFRLATRAAEDGDCRPECRHPVHLRHCFAWAFMGSCWQVTLPTRSIPSSAASAPAPK